MTQTNERIDRRGFLHKGVAVAAGVVAVGTSALSYSRIRGANDRIALGHVGAGFRGGELDGMIAEVKGTENVEMTAVCDLWTVNLEKAVAR